MLDVEAGAAVEIVNAEGMGPVCLLCEHASALIPAEFNNLGLSAEQNSSHAVWDPGARDLALRLSAALDAPLVASRMSRLIYDCNRPPQAKSAIPDQSETIEVPGNRGLRDSARQRRIELAYTPFIQAVDELLDARRTAGQLSVLVTVHSFSPVYFEQKRTVEIGILHDSDTRLADAMLARSENVRARVVSRNEPYGPLDGVTHSLQIHAISRGLPNVMLEVRNDLLTDDAAVQRVCNELVSMLQPAVDELHRGNANA